VRIRYFADIRFPIERANGVQTMETCHALAGLGHAVDLVVRPDTHTPARDAFAYYGVPRDRPLTVTAVATPDHPATRRAGYLAHTLRLAVGADDVDILYTRDLAVASMLLAVPSAMRAPLVYESHGFAPAVSAAMPVLMAGGQAPTDRKTRRLERREHRVWRQADGYVTITHGLLTELEGRYGTRSRVAVAPDGARVPKVCPPLPDSGTRRPVIGYAGHLYPWKGIDVLLDAVSEMPDADALVIGGLAGESDLARVRALADRLAPGRVTFAGQLDPPHVAARLAAADVLVVPNTVSRLSATYTSPLKLFEYMASGRPIVASNLPSLREVLTDGETAVLAEPGNATSLRAALRRVLADRTLAASLAARAFDAVQSYSWDRRAERVVSLLEKVRAARPRRAPGSRRMV
jgi:glycosyltransferase involved in cell wall biosynthesis